MKLVMKYDSLKYAGNVEKSQQKIKMILPLKQIFLGTVGRFCKLPDGTSFTTSGDFWPNGATCGTECADGYLHRS